MNYPLEIDPGSQQLRPFDHTQTTFAEAPTYLYRDLLRNENGTLTRYTKNEQILDSRRTYNREGSDVKRNYNRSDNQWYALKKETEQTMLKRYKLKSTNPTDLVTSWNSAGNMDYLLHAKWNILLDLDAPDVVTGGSILLPSGHVLRVFDLIEVDFFQDKIPAEEYKDMTLAQHEDDLRQVGFFYWKSSKSSVLRKCHIRHDKIFYIETGTQLIFVPNEFYYHGTPSSSTEPKKKVQLWSNIRNRNLHFETNYVLTQIRTRYAMFDRPIAGLQNVVIDSFIPKLMYQTRIDPRYMTQEGTNLPKTAVAISPWFAKLFGVKQMPTVDMCNFLGYSIQDISALLRAVKKLKFTPTFVGYGGTGVNSIHWLTEMCKMTNIVNLFQDVYLFEPEQIEISNLLRFPKDPSTVHTTRSDTKKIELLSADEKRILARRDFVAHQRFHIIPRTPMSNMGNQKQFTYGAPGLAYRHELSTYGNFISATHMGNTCNLFLNPTQDTELQVESYGLIQLSPFFMNQLRLAIGLLEFLSIDPDLSIKDSEIMTSEFSGISQARSGLNYNFQMTHTGLVATPEEAANVV